MPRVPTFLIAASAGLFVDRLWFPPTGLLDALAIVVGAVAAALVVGEKASRPAP